MSAFKPQQRRLVFNSRAFHFVAYEGQPENQAKLKPAEPAMWCLMVEGRRCPVTPFDPEQPDDAVERALIRWLKEHVMPAA